MPELPSAVYMYVSSRCSCAGVGHVVWRAGVEKEKVPDDEMEKR